MSEFKDIQALGKINSEVDNSHAKIILSSQCMKAQIFLADRLRKESERQKQVCKNLLSGNLKLEAEIKHAEQQLRSLKTAQETVKMSNVDLQKQYLMAKESKLETINRVEAGETKYEQLWLSSKKRFESFPSVQKWFECTNKTESLKERIHLLLQEADALKEEIKFKKATLQEDDKKRIIEMATLLVHERPKKEKEIQEQMQKLLMLATEIDEYEKKQTAGKDSVKPRADVVTAANIMSVDGDWPSLCDGFGNDELLGELNDLDISDVNLEQIKKYVAAPITSKSQEARVALAWETQNQKENSYTLSFFEKSYFPQETGSKVNMEEETKLIARKKLINILEDIAIDKKEAESMMSTVDPHALQEVTEIGASIDDSRHSETGLTEIEQTENADIEEIDMSAGTSNNIVVPPIQFMDFSQERDANNAILQQEVEVVIEATCVAASSLSQPKSSQEGSQKKRVAFYLPPIEEDPEEAVGGEANDTKHDEAAGSYKDNSSGGKDDSFTEMKQMILRKHHLDLSPDFIYEKKSTNKKTDDKIITSKFFTHTQKRTDDDDVQMQRIEEGTQKKQLESEEKVGNTVSGLLFTHGPHGMPDSLDVSVSTTGFEDADGEFPHCIDSSLLLSPKADIPMPVVGCSNEVGSQEVPNFLTGMRKTGLSFFGKSSGVCQPDSSAAKDANNFSFNFNKGDDKKSRSSLFSMFQ